MIRYIFIILVSLISALAFTTNAQAQKKKNDKAEKVTVKARLVDQEGNAISNAEITVGEGLLQAFSDEEGNFSIRTESNSMLLIEATGYESKWIDLRQGMPDDELILSQELLFSSKQDIIELPLNIKSDRRSLTGAVSNIRGKALETYPDLSLSNALQGRLMGLTTRQSVNGLGYNNSALYIRGLSRGGADGIITIVDGIERDIDYLVPEEIESIEVLKDATAKILYGPRAANGVLMVTTKRGRANTKKLTASVNYGASFVTRLPKFLNSYEYANLYNEARENDGLSPFYSDADLEGYRNSAGPNDQRYPDVDFYDQFINKSAQFRKATLEYSGGDESNQYALILAYTGGDGLEKLGNDPTLNRFNLRGNLDIEINKVISANIGASGVVETREWGTVNNSQAFSAMSSHRPNEYPFIISDPSLHNIVVEGDDSAIPPLGGSYQRSANLYGDFLYGGFSESQTFYGQTNIGLNFDFNDLISGLSASAYYTIDNYQFFQNGKIEVPVSYAQRWFQVPDGQDTVQYYQLRKRTIEDNQSRQNENYYNNSGWTATLAYDKKFGEHEVSANFTHFFYQKDHDNWVQDLRFTNTTFRLKHGFNNKIYTEIIMAYMGSDKMSVENRYQLFPAVGTAWVLSEEGFLRDNEAISFLKLKASFGILGYDRSTDYYLYENRWNTFGNIQFDERNRTSTTRTQLQSLGNPDLDWEKSRELNVGIEGLVLANHLQFELNYFNTYRYDIIQFPSYRYPATAGGMFSQVNQGENLNKGIEGQVTWVNSVGDLSYSFGANFIYSKNEVIKMNEEVYPDELDYNRQTGYASDVIFGYASEGLFTEQSQLDNHAEQTFGSYGLGSLSYEDLNNDGIIDDLDRKVLGNSYPRSSLGINLDLNYKGFGLFILGTAELGVDNLLNNTYYRNSGEGKYSVLASERYHPVNNPDGSYPALTTTSASNNFVNSSFWIEDASFFRLKNVELSYTLPSTFVARAYKFYVRGTNLLLVSKNKDLDPEALNAGVTNYPVFRTVVGGVSLSF